MGGPGDSDGPASGAASSNRPDGARPRTAPRTRLELVSADPAGHVAVWEGWIRGPRAQIGTQAVGRTRTAVPLTQMNRMFGLVGGDLMWTQDMAAFGETEPKTYASGRLGRVQGPDAGIAVPAGTAAAEASAVPAASAPAGADADAGADDTVAPAAAPGAPAGAEAADPTSPAAAGASAPSAFDARAAGAETDRKAQS